MISQSLIHYIIGHDHERQYNSETASKVVRKNIRTIVTYVDMTEFAIELLAQDLTTDHLCEEVLSNRIRQERFLFEVYKVVKIGKGNFSKFLKALRNIERGDEVASLLQQSYGMYIVH